MPLLQQQYYISGKDLSTEIAVLLAQAEAQFKAKRLTEPAGNNAAATYRQVLAQDAGNAQAQAGLERIAREYLKQAQEQRSAGALQESLKLIDKGLAVLPNQAELLRLRGEVQKQQQREQEITALLAQAEAQFEAERLTEPAADNAAATYRQVLALDAGNAKAQAGLERIAREYLQQARQQRSAGALRDSLKLIDKGLAVLPNQAELLRLREEVQKKQQWEQKIAALLAQAEAQFEAKRLTEPAGDNAAATYRQVLELDAGNAQARAGLERIAREYLQQARQRQSARALQESLNLIDKGLAVLPNQAELLRLREEVSAQLAAEQQKTLEQQRLEQQRLEQQRKEQQRLEQQRLEQQRLEQQRLEQQRKEQQRLEQQRLEEKQRQEQQKKLEQQRLEQQRLEQQRLEQQRKEQQRLEQQRQEQQRTLEKPPLEPPKIKRGWQG